MTEEQEFKLARNVSSAYAIIDDLLAKGTSRFDTLTVTVDIYDMYEARARLKELQPIISEAIQKKFL